MIERGLHGHTSNGAQYVRIDGKVPVKKRGPILSRFQNNPNVRIILLTISCGACG
jgi:SNF2 family DNA or RNA helicase